jgi:predicted kinase
LARDYGFQVKIVYLEPPLPRLLAQNKKRPAPVPESVILSLLEKLDVPLVSEAHEILLVP